MKKNQTLHNATSVHNSYGEMLIRSLILFLFQTLLIQGEVINDPTIKPTKDFSACKDADALLNNGSIDAKLVSNILYHRTFNERKQIEHCFNTKYGAQNTLSLLGKIQITKEKDLNSLNQWSMKAPEEILGNTIHDVISSGAGEVGDIEEVICANDRQMKDRIDKYYQLSKPKICMNFSSPFPISVKRFNLLKRKYDRMRNNNEFSLEEYQTTVPNHLATFRSNDKVYQEVMQKYCWIGLCQDMKITPEEADREAQALRGIHAKKHKTNLKNKLIELLNKYCEPDLKLIFQKYRHGNNGIEDAISDAFDVDRQSRAFSHLARYMEDVCKYYAFELRHAADDSCDIHTDKINRIVLTRSERDLFCIAKAYPSQDKGYKTFTSRLSNKIGWRHYYKDLGGSETLENLYVESIRYLMGKP